MKRFMVYLAIILVVVSMGFGAYYIFKKDGGAALGAESVYVIVGDEFEIDVDWKGKKPFTSYSVLISNSNVVSYDEARGRFKAESGGHTIVTFRFETTNARFRNLMCQVFVGDGSSIAPFYISNAQDFLKIGNPNIPNNKFTMDKAYELLRDIDLIEGVNNSGYYVPVGSYDNSAFTGVFNGKGHTIKNVNINFYEYNKTATGGYIAYSDYAGLFGKIGPNGFVYDLKIDNFIIEGSAYSRYVGTVAGYSNGKIVRVEIKNSVIDIQHADFIGGVVGQSESLEINDNRYTARVDRVSANILLGAQIVEGELKKNGIGGVIGGLVGNNIGGIVIYSYANGVVVLNSLAEIYGGIVGQNAFVAYNNFEENRYFNSNAGNIKDNYTILELLVGKTNGKEDLIIGGVIGKNIDTFIDDAQPDVLMNRIIGNYFSTTNLNLREFVEVEGAYIPVEKNYAGLGKYIKDGIVTTYQPQEYAINGVDNDQLRTSETYISHINYVPSFDESGNGEQVSEEPQIVSWKFNFLWFINSAINNGYPYLTYENIDISDEINNISDGIKIKSYQDLKNMLPNRHYVLVSDIDMSKEMVGESWTEWTPIGTESKPFTGTFEAGSYILNGKKHFFKLINFEYNPTSVTKYGGLFGVTAGGEIKNVVISNAKVSNVEYGGVLAGTNGYVYSYLNEQNQADYKNVEGSKISNIKIIASTVVATKSAGGVVGSNYGNINGAFVDAVYNAQNAPTIISNINLQPGEDDSSVGGIVGQNFGRIARAFVKGDTKIYAGQVTTSASVEEDESSDQPKGYPTAFNIYVGGIAGINNNEIFESKVEEIEISVQDNLKSVAGGLVGKNQGKITRSLTNKITIYADPTNENNYAGGIVGYHFGDAYIANVGTYNNSITAYVAGGIAGNVYYQRPGHIVKISKNDNGNLITKDDQNFITIEFAGVNGGVISGSVVGGIFGMVQNGVISDVYAITSLDGVSDKSNVSGMVGVINYSTALNKSTNIGVIQKAYVSVTFGDTGVKYAVSKSDFLKDPLIGSRDAGYIFNYMFNDEIDGNAKHPYGTWDLWGLIKVKNRAKTSQLQSRSRFVDYSFSENYWNFEEGKYVTIKEVDALNEEISGYKVEWLYNKYITIETNVTIKRLDSRIHYVFIENGETFTFQLTLDDFVDPSSIKVIADGKELIANSSGQYSIYGILKNIELEIIFYLK